MNGQRILALIAGAWLAALTTAFGAEPAPVATDVNVTSKFALKIYGYLRLDASYDTQKTQSGDLMFYVLPKDNGESDNEFNMTAKETRLGLDLTCPEAGPFTVSGKLETDFYGSGGSANSPNLRMRLAYLDLGYLETPGQTTTIRAGQDWETLITVLPKIVNFSYLNDCGALGTRRPQFRVTHETELTGDTKLIAKIAAARPIGEGADGDLDKGRQDDGADSGIPNIQGNVILQTRLLTAKPTKISVSGHWGLETLDTTASNKVVVTDSKNYDTWSVIGTLSFPIIDKVTLQGTIWSGANLDTYYGGIGQGINTNLDIAIQAAGGYAQLIIDITSRLNWNLSYGIDTPQNSDLSAGMRSRNQMFFTSLFYDIVPKTVTAAFEYSYIQTDYKSQENAADNRFQGAMIYRF